MEVGLARGRFEDGGFDDGEKARRGGARLAQAMHALRSREFCKVHRLQTQNLSSLTSLLLLLHSLLLFRRELLRLLKLVPLSARLLLLPLIGGSESEFTSSPFRAPIFGKDCSDDGEVSVRAGEAPGKESCATCSMVCSAPSVVLPLIGTCFIGSGVGGPFGGRFSTTGAATSSTESLEPSSEFTLTVTEFDLVVRAGGSIKSGALPSPPLTTKTGSSFR